MSQLGYTWYPQDWWTSETFKRLKRFPLVRYALRELFDLMYKEGRPVEMNREYLIDDFNIELSDEEYNKLLEFIVIEDDGKWWTQSIRKRLSKAEAARENGKNGGRPPKKIESLNIEIKDEKIEEKPDEEKTQKPSEKTQAQNPQNPPLEKKEKRKEKETNINIDFPSLLSFINTKTERQFKTINEKVRKSFRARIKEGYTKADIINAIVDASNSEYHMGNGRQYLTPEFFSRSDTLDKYSKIKNPEAIPQEKQILGPWAS